MRLHYAPGEPPSFGRTLRAPLTHLLLTGMLALFTAVSALGQARPDVQWMRGVIAGSVRRMVLSPNGQNIALCGTDGTTKIRRLSDGMLLETLVDSTASLGFGGTPPTVNTLAYTPDGTKILTGNNASTIHLWDVATGAVLHTWTAPAAVNSVAIAPDGTKFAAGMTSNDILLWNLGDYSAAGTLGGHTSGVNAVVFSPDSQKLASASADKSVRIWRVSDGISLQTLTDTAGVGSVVFAADNVTVCSGNNSGVIRIWNATTGGAALRSITGSAGFSSQTIALTISPDGTRLSAGYAQTDTKIHTWRINDAAPLLTVETGFTVASLVSDGTQIYSTDAANHVNIWASANLASAGALPIPFASAVSTVTTNPTGSVVVTGSYDGQVKFWNPITGALLSTIVPVSGTTAADKINALAFSRDGTQFAIAGVVPNSSFGNDVGYLWIYKAADNTLIRVVTVTASSLAYTQGDTMLAAGVGNNINLYQTSNMALVQTLTGHTGTVNAIAISPDGTKLASGSSDSTVKTWNLATFLPLRTLAGHVGSILSVNFSPDGLTLADAGSDSKSLLWRIEDGAKLQTFTHTESVQTAVISRDGKQVATGSTDRHLKIWNAASGSLLYDYTQETGAPIGSNSPNGVTAAVYSQDGKYLYYGRNDWTFVATANPLFVPLITGLTLTPNNVVGGASVTGTVTLNSTTLTGGAVITLSTDNPDVASLPFATVTVPQGSAIATFTVNTSAVSTLSTASITAGLNGSSATAVLTVAPPTVSSFTVSPASVRGGQSTTATVTLTGPAPTGGLVVALSSSNPNAIAPATITVPGGAISASISISTSVVGVQNSAVLSATLGRTATATLTITPPVVTALSTSPANLKGGQNSTGTVTISDPAPTGGILVTLATDKVTIASTVPSVTVPAGATTATFAITTRVVNAVTSVTFTGTFNNSSQTTVLTVTPPTVDSVSFSPAGVKGSLNSTGTVTISDPAPAAGLLVTLSSATPTVVGVPASVTVASGSTTATFAATTTPVTADTPVVVTAAVGTATAAGTLTVQTPGLIGLALNPTNVYAFTSSTAIVTLDAPAPAGGTVVTLASPNPAQASMPGTATVPAGSTTVTVPITVGNVTVTTSLLLSATLGSVTKTATLVILPHLPFDFDNDGHNDLVLQNSQNGTMVVWFLNGLTVRGGSTINLTPPAGWQVVGVADFNRSGTPDLALQNQTTGNIVIWYLNGTTVTEGSATSIPPGVGYKVVGVADFNNDGKPDFLFQNQTSGQLVVWFMDGSTVIGGSTIATQPFPGYQVVGVGDFNKDGQPDIVMQNSSTNQIVVWYMNGIAYNGGGFTSSAPASAWKVKGIADYNNDGWPDIVFQNNSTNQVVTWFMNGLTVTGGDLLSIQPLVPYLVVGPH
jgi:WD40 repeat protein